MRVDWRYASIVGCCSLACNLSPSGPEGQLSGGGVAFGGGADDEDADGDGSAATDGADAETDGESATTGDDADGAPQPDPMADTGSGGAADDAPADAGLDGDEASGDSGSQDDAGEDGPDGATCPSDALDDSLPTMHVGTTVGQADLHQGSCGGSGPDLGLSFTAPEDGLYTFSTDGSDFDTVLYLIDGGVCDGAELGCDDDSGASTQSQLSVPLSAGQEVVVMIDGYQITADGAFSVATSVLPSTCGGANALASAVPVTTTGTTAGPSQASGTCGGEQAPEAFFEWTAPADGLYRISTDGSAYDTVLHVRDGDCLGQQLACDDDGGAGLQSEVQLDLQAGQAIVVIVDGYSDHAGDFVLTID